jgi:hypothetical protein
LQKYHPFTTTKSVKIVKFVKNMGIMNAAEIKLDLFRKIDKLKDIELERKYQAFLSLLAPTEKYSLTKAEKDAIEEALESSETYTHGSVVKQAKSRYPQLKFK